MNFSLRFAFLIQLSIVLVVQSYRKIDDNNSLRGFHEQGNNVKIVSIIPQI